MRKFLMLMVLFAGCEQVPPESNDCVEFTHQTLKHGRPLVCQMLWCNHPNDLRGHASGMATLWCEE